MSTLIDNTQIEPLVFDASTPEKRPIALPQKSDFAWLLQFTSLAGNILDLTGWSVDWNVYDSNGNTVLALTSATGMHGSFAAISSATAGMVVVYLNLADAPAGFCTHELILQDTSGARFAAVRDALYGTSGSNTTIGVIPVPVTAVAQASIDAASAPITAAKAVMAINGGVTLASSTALSLGLTHAGIAITSGTAGGTTTLVTSGLLPLAFGVGAGVACAVGSAADGSLVRVTSTACVSGLKHVGNCDVNGAVVIAPRKAAYFDVTDFGAIANSDGAGGGTDQTAAFQACIDAAGQFIGYSISGGPAGGRVFIPDGRYRFSGPLHIRRSIVFEGAHGNGWYGSVSLIWDADVAIDTNDDGGIGCLVIDNYYSGPLTPSGTAGMQGEWSVLKNLILAQVPGGNPFNLCHGIAQIATATLDHVFITGFQGDGLRACTHVGFHTVIDSSDYPRLFVTLCGRHGIHMVGADAQVCNFGMAMVESNGAWGVKEESFFGNNYNTLLTESNGYFNNAGTWIHGGNYVAAANIWSSSKSVTFGQTILPTPGNQSGYQYKVSTTAPSTLGAVEPSWPTTVGATVVSGGATLVCWEEEGGSVRVPQGGVNASCFGYLYTESDQNPPRLPRCTVLGGLWTPDTVIANQPAFGVYEGAILPMSNVAISSTVPLTLSLGVAGSDSAFALAFKRSAEPSTIGLQWNDTTKQWQFIWAGTTDFLNFSGPDNPQGPGRLVLPDGFSAGRNASQKQMRWMATQPSATSTDWSIRLWSQGDVVWNTAPTSGGPPGWVCTASGGWGGGHNYTSRTWTTALSVYLGDGIEPTTPTGNVYVCTVTGLSYGSYGITAGTEPNWAAAPAVGNTVTNGDGIVWTNYGPVGATFKAMANLA